MKSIATPHGGAVFYGIPPPSETSHVASPVHAAAARQHQSGPILTPPHFVPPQQYQQACYGKVPSPTVTTQSTAYYNPKMASAIQSPWAQGMRQLAMQNFMAARPHAPYAYTPVVYYRPTVPNGVRILNAATAVHSGGAIPGPVKKRRRRHRKRKRKNKKKEPASSDEMGSAAEDEVIVEDEEEAFSAKPELLEGEAVHKDDYLWDDFDAGDEKQLVGQDDSYEEISGIDRMVDVDLQNQEFDVSIRDELLEIESRLSRPDSGIHDVDSEATKQLKMIAALRKVDRADSGVQSDESDSEDNQSYRKKLPKFMINDDEEDVFNADTKEIIIGRIPTQPGSEKARLISARKGKNFPGCCAPVCTIL